MVAQWYHLIMATLTIKQIPPVLVERLKERAEINGRSMNKEVIACLEAVVMPVEPSAEEAIAAAKRLWDDLGLKNLPPYDPAWKREGRP